MPRPRKCRKVCCLPKFTGFVPSSKVCSDKNCGDTPGNTITMTVDEYETLRLIDKEGFSQEECSSYMNVARTTVQQIYNNARHKIALAIVDGKPLQIQGGDYTLCDGKESQCRCGGCKHHRSQCVRGNDYPQKKEI